MAIDIIVEPFESPRVVTIPISVGRSVTIQDLYDAMRAWGDSVTGMHYPFLVDGAGKEDLGGGRSVGITMTLRNTQVQFEPGNDIHSQGSSTANTDDKLITDSVATFLSDGIHKGDQIINITTASMGVVMEVIDNNNVRLQNMVGGSRQNWLIGDLYLIVHIDKCSITGGNMVAVDDVGSPIDPILGSPNCNVATESSTSAAGILTGSGVTAQDKIDIAVEVLEKLLSDHDTTDGSLAQAISIITNRTSTIPALL